MIKQKNQITKPILLAIVTIILAYFLIMLLLWASAIYHEEGHLQACKIVGIACEPQIKSFPEYLLFKSKGLIFGPMYSKEMNMTFEEKEFCNLTEQQKQLIRVSGFRTNLLILSSFTFCLFLLTGLFGVIYLSQNFFKKSRSTLLKITGWGILVIITIISILALQMTSYFMVDLGDLFYFPC